MTTIENPGKKITTAAQALRLAELGFKVFPCHKNKTPATTRGHNDATTDSLHIRRLRWANQLIGIACEPSGIWALDIDVKNDAGGLESLAHLIETAGAGAALLPMVGPAQKTPTGGSHYLFKLPPDLTIPNNAGQLAPGLDLRSKGYICTGAGYSWYPDHGPETPLTQAPAWLLAEIAKLNKPTPAPASIMAPVEYILKNAGDIGDYFVGRALSRAILGTRNENGLWLAIQLRDARMSQSDAERYMIIYQSRVPGDDYTEAEALATLKSAYGRSPREPAFHQAPPMPEEPPLAMIEPPQPTQAPDRWRAFTLADAYQDRPPVEYIAADLFALPSLNIVYGAPGTLKSYVMQDLAACVAGGINWLPIAPWSTIKGPAIKVLRAPVMWVDFDNGQRRTHDRFGELGRGHGLATDAPLIYYSMPSPWLDASKPDQINDLHLRIIATGARLVIIDNLSLIAGDVDENSAQMGKVCSNFRKLAESTGAALVLIHHQRKSTGIAGRAGDTLRGHSSIEGSLDLALLVEREDDSRMITLRPTKVRGPDVSKFTAYFEPNEDQRTVRFYGLITEDTRSDSAIERAIVEVLAAGELNKSNLVKEVKEVLVDAGVNRIRGRIDWLVDQRKITTREGARPNELLYSVARMI